MPRWAKKVEDDILKKDDILTVSSKVFQVFDSKGDFVRDYSVELSGENAGELAKIFSEEIGGTVKTISTVK